MLRAYNGAFIAILQQCLYHYRSSMPAPLQGFYACVFAGLLCLRLCRASMPASSQGFYGSAGSFLRAAHLCAVAYAFIGLLQRWTIPARSASLRDCLRLRRTLEPSRQC